ncbi:MAG: carbohydrate ABC transporter permease [Treponema sp.]|nr:carbohydrate ABC transporter permease [Treponema sp.]
MKASVSVMIIAAVVIALALLARSGSRGQKITIYVFLAAVAAAMVLPFYCMLVMSTQTTTEIYRFPPSLFFGSNLLNNFSSLMKAVNIVQAFFNSLLISGSFTVLTLLFCSMGGYAFAMYRFPGRKALFSILLGTMMIPWTASIIPWYIMMTRFGWLNNYLALIIPNCASAFGIFWMRQYCFNNVPPELVDAAKIDGCPESLIFFRIIAPVLLPAYAALGIMTFVNSWNDFMSPLLILKDKALHTLPLMLRYMVGDPLRGTDMGSLLLANTLAVLPLLIVFLAASKYFMSGLTAGAVKG